MPVVMFNPYTGKPRHPLDIQSDPGGLLILEPGAPVISALKRLSFAAQTTGGTAGLDAELQAAIGEAEQALSTMGDMPKPNEPKRPPGRPEVQPEDRLQVVSIRLTEAQKAKLDRLGGSAWLREKIDRAKEPK